MGRCRLLVFVCLAMCMSACTSAYYKTMQKFGKEKRDILVARVKDSKKDQEQTKEQLKTTMETFQELTGFKGGDLEKSYKKLNSEYEKAEGQATNSGTALNQSTRSATTCFLNGKRKLMRWVMPG